MAKLRMSAGWYSFITKKSSGLSALSGLRAQSEFIPAGAIRQANISQGQGTKKDGQKMMGSSHGAGHCTENGWELVCDSPSMEIDLPCQRCAACCRWPGEVRLSDVEVTKLATFMGLCDKEFIETHTRLRADRRGLALKAREDHSCIFLDGNCCTVQAVKP